MVPQKAPVPLVATGSAAWQRGVTRLKGQDRKKVAELGLITRRLLVVVLAAGLAWFVSSASTSANETTLALVALLIWVHFLPLLLPRKPDFFSPIGYTCLVNAAMFATILAFYATRPFFEDGFPLAPTALATLLERTFLAWLLASVAYFAGYFAGRRKNDPPLVPLPPGAARAVAEATPPWSQQRLFAVCALFYLVFLPSYAFFQARVGASLTDATELAAGKAVWREDPTLSWMIRGVALGLVPPLLLLVVALTNARMRFVKFATVGALALVTAFLVVRLGQRGVVAFFFINVACMVHYLWKRIPLGVLLVSALVLLSVGNLLGEFRRRGAEQTLNFDPVRSLADMEADRLHTFAFATVMYYWPERRDWLLGESFAGIAVMPIPRWLWPEKSEHFMMRDTTIVNELAGRPIPSQFPAVMYANFGWPGIAAGMFLLGWFHRRLYAWLCRNQQNGEVVLLYSVMLLHFGPTLLALSDAIQFVLPTAAAVWFCRRRLAGRRAVGRIPAAHALAAADEPTSPTTTPSLGA